MVKSFPKKLLNRSSRAQLQVPRAQPGPMAPIEVQGQSNLYVLQKCGSQYITRKSK